MRLGDVGECRRLWRGHRCWLKYLNASQMTVLHARPVINIPMNSGWFNRYTICLFWRWMWRVWCLVSSGTPPKHHRPTFVYNPEPVTVRPDDGRFQLLWKILKIPLNCLFSSFHTRCQMDPHKSTQISSRGNASLPLTRGRSSGWIWNEFTPMNRNLQTLVGYYLGVYLETTVLFCFISYNCDRMGYICVGAQRWGEGCIYGSRLFCSLIFDFFVLS